MWESYTSLSSSSVLKEDVIVLMSRDKLKEPPPYLGERQRSEIIMNSYPFVYAKIVLS